MSISLVSFREACNIGSSDFIRTYMVSEYAELIEFMLCLLGGTSNTEKTRTRPHEHPDHPGYFCSQAAVVQNHPLGLGVNSGGLKPVPDLAIVEPFTVNGGILVEAVYRPLLFSLISETGVGESQDDFDCVNVLWKYSVKSVTLAKTRLGWADSSNSFNPSTIHQISYEDVRPQVAHTFTTIQMTRLMVPAACFPSEAFSDKVGTLNKNTIRLETTGKKYEFRPGTLRFEAPERSPRCDYAGRHYDDITITWSHYDRTEIGYHNLAHPCGWNSLLRPTTLRNELVAVIGTPARSMFGVTDRWLDCFDLGAA